ncbi:MAG: FAD-binding oxidoreductase [Gemmatimonadaceae bacterium]
MRRRTFIQSAVAAAAVISIPRHQVFAAATRVVPRRRQDVEAITGDGERVILTAAAIADLKARLRGRVLLAGDEGYDQARQILNPSFDKRPALIVQPTGTADIRTAVNFARDNRGLLLAVKCGGHSASGQSTCDRGMMVDLSLFRDVRVDPLARRAWVTGGALLGQVDHETMAYGLVTPMGTVSHTGVGGLVTGGGFGRVARRFGLSVDNLASVNVVTADGEFQRASASENPDLFWGVRGGGGNFGIVTSFEFRLHPMQRTVTAGQIIYPIARAREVLQVLAEYGPEAPDELELQLVMALPPGGAPGVIMFPVCYSGPENGADRALAPLRKLGNPIADNVQPMDYVAVQRSGDITDPRAEGSYLKSGFVSRIPPELISAIVERFEGHPQRSTAIFFAPCGGAIARVPANATAFAQRDAQWNMLSAVGWKHGDDTAAHVQWIKQYWAGLERFTHGFYVNDLELDHSAAAIRNNYRQNHDRLVAVKTKYDPKNLFRLNANVKPTPKT